MKLLLISIFLITYPVLLQAQDIRKDKEPAKWQFRSINQFGILIGASSTEPSIQSVNGVQFKKWFAGAGIGLDYYKERSIPVFLDIRRNICSSSNSPFIYAAGGKHFAWRTSPPKEWISRGLKGGWFYDAGAGYNVRINERKQLVLSVGYSVKLMSEEVNTLPWISAFPLPAGAMQKREYTLSRISFKMGLGL
jgi:hypothetical protein